MHVWESESIRYTYLGKLPRYVPVPAGPGGWEAMKNKIRELRARKGWSQAELARRLGVSRQTVIAIEKGRYDPSLPLAFKIARVFGEPIEAIFLPEEDDELRA